MHDPRQEYLRRVEIRRSAVAGLEARHRQIGNLRLLLAVAVVAILWLAWTRGAPSYAWALAPAAAFVLLAILHERVLRQLSRARRAAEFYERALARLDDRWAGGGEPGERFRDPAHPYSEDLDLFGRASLFELLCSARTHAGEEVLASWLTAAAPPEGIRERQAAVTELAPRMDLRERLAVLGEEVRTGVDSEALAGWSTGPPVLGPGWEAIGAKIFPVLVLASVAGWVAFDWRNLFLVLLVAEQGFALWLRRRVMQVVQEVEHPAHDLALLAEVLKTLEREPFSAPRLVEVRAALNVSGQPPSRRIARLNRLMELLDSRENWLMKLAGPVLLWTQNLTFAIEKWRRQSGPAVPGWLAAVGEIEALCSLAGYAYEHPDDSFPEFTAESPVFEAEALAHPLLPRTRAVANDLRLGAAVRVLVVSGSNMSGKSTLLRTAGLNAVLAHAGAPVRARRLWLSPVALGASIRILDSLQSGKSRFYAEITRLRAIVDLTDGAAPVLFLLDELLHGTNSHDRRIGAEAIVRRLVARGAFGLLTTHDLALAHLAGGADVHFEDHLEDGVMRFDYRLRPGIVQKSNALELMRSVGLLEAPEGS